MVINILFFIYWLFFNRRFVWTSLFVLLIGYFVLGSFIEFQANTEETNTEEGIKVLTYNALGFRGVDDHGTKEDKDKVLSFIKKQDADIVSIQEFSTYNLEKGDFKEYPYQHINNGVKNGHVGLAILSKYPIIKKNDLAFPHSTNHAIYSDILIHEDTISVYNLHLESLKIRPGMLKREASDKLVKRLSYSFSKQQDQAILFRENADANPHKKIVTGDFNNTQFSSAYRIIKGDMNDSFTEKGSGYGKTIDFWHFPLRIDFILVDRDFEIQNHENFKLGISDHEPVLATVKLSVDK